MWEEKVREGRFRVLYSGSRSSFHFWDSLISHEIKEVRNLIFSRRIRMKEKTFFLTIFLFGAPLSACQRIEILPDFFPK